MTESECEEALREAAAKLADYDASFDLRWEADMRAIKRWREEAPGREFRLPDHADLCVWLLGQLERIEVQYHDLLTETERK